MDFISQVTLKHLRCFIEVYHSHSVAEAARTLSITQSAASRRIADLEAALSLPLFQRRERKLIPNSAAHLLLRHTESALHTLGTGLDRVSARKSAECPVLSIGALPTVAGTLVPRAVLKLRAVIPDVIVRIETGAGDQLMPRLQAGRLDCVVGRMATVDRLEGLHFDALYQDRLALVTRAQHPLAQDESPNLAEVLRYPVILPPENAVIRPVVEALLKSRGMGFPADRIETTATSVAMSILKQTDAIWFISRGVAEAAVAYGGMAFLKIDTLDTIGSIGMTRRADKENCAPELLVFFDMLRTCATSKEPDVEHTV